MKISVIIINWNRRDDVRRAVASVLPALQQDDEVMVWDNASRDHSVESLREAFSSRPAFRLLESPANVGVCSSRNQAVQQAAGDILVFMDSDSVLETPDTLSHLASRFAQPDQPGALNFEIRRPDGAVLWPFARRQSTWGPCEFPITRIDGCGFAVKRNAFETAGGFPEHFGYGAEEHYLARRLIALGWAVIYYPKVAVTHHQAPSGRTSDQFATMMRNHIWMPLELFCMPWALVSALGMLVSYGRDAWRERRIQDFRRGLWWTIRDFRWSRRQPMSRHAWHRFRAIIAEDRALAASP